MWAMPAPIPVVNEPDGAELESRVGELPEPHRDAIRWHYVYQGPPARIVRSLGVTYETLAFLVIDGRRILMSAESITPLEHHCSAFIHASP